MLYLGDIVDMPLETDALLVLTRTPNPVQSSGSINLQDIGSGCGETHS